MEKTEIELRKWAEDLRTKGWGERHTDCSATMCVCGTRTRLSQRFQRGIKGLATAVSYVVHDSGESPDSQSTYRSSHVSPQSRI